MIPAVSYLRMSTEAQEASIPSQRTAIKKYAATNGYRIIREYVDSGISGDDTERRVAFLKMRADAPKGEFSVVLCWDQDRFGRFDLMDAGFWIKPLRDAGVSLATVTQGVIDWNDFAGRLVYSIQQEGKHQFLRDLSRNVNRGKLAKAQEGKWMGGAAPYGYKLVAKATLGIEDEEAAVVRLMFKLFIERGSITSVRDELNRRQLVGPASNTWRNNSIIRMIDNMVYCGHVRWNRTCRCRYSATVAGTVVARSTNGKDVRNDESAWTIVRNAHPAIITEAQFEAAKKIRTNAELSWAVGRPTGKVMFFRRILKCGFCGRAMHGAWVANMNDVAYVCSEYSEKRDCTANRTYQKPLRDAVIAWVQDNILSESVIAKAKQKIRETTRPSIDESALASACKRKATLTAKLAKAEQRLLEVPTDMISVVAEQIRSHRTEISQLERQIASTEAERSKPPVDLEAIMDAEIKQLRSLVAIMNESDETACAEVMPLAFERISVRSIIHPLAGAPKGKYTIESIDVVVKSLQIPIV